MSCDYWRREYWRQLGKLFKLSSSGRPRTPNGDLPDWVKDIVKDVLEDMVEDIIKNGLEDDLEDVPIPESTRRTLQRTRTSSHFEYSLEVTYRRAKYSSWTQQKQWTQEERNSAAKKTRRLLRRIRLLGLPENASPVHGRTGLPRISSQAGYAAVYDLLVKMGFNLGSIFDPVYDAGEDSKDLTSAEGREVVYLVERIEGQVYKGSEADISSIVKDIQRIRAISSEIFDLLMQIFQRLSSKRRTSLERRNLAKKVLAGVASFEQAG